MYKQRLKIGLLMLLSGSFGCYRHECVNVWSMLLM